MREIFIEVGEQQPPFRTISELAELVKSRFYSVLIVDNASFTSELVNSASDFAPLHEAFLINPLIPLPTISNATGYNHQAEAACHLLLQHSNYRLRSNIFTSFILFIDVTVEYKFILQSKTTSLCSRTPLDFRQLVTTLQ